MTGFPSWLLREIERDDRHSRVSVFVGPDFDHRRLAGILVLDRDEADDLFDIFEDDDHGDVERFFRRCMVPGCDGPAEAKPIGRASRDGRAFYACAGHVVWMRQSAEVHPHVYATIPGTGLIVMDAETHAGEDPYQ